MAERQNKFEILATNTKKTINAQYAKSDSIQIDINKIVPFKNHPFKVIDNDEMKELEKSIKEQGIITPVILRKIDSKFEIISGHRRVHAAKKIGLKFIPSIIKELDDDQATIFMVDSNKQREVILPSERAWSYRMKAEAMNHRGKRTDLTSDVMRPKLKTTKEIALEDGIGETKVKKFIRLTYLTQELLDMVDNKKLGFTIAVEISYLTQKQQGWIAEWIANNQMVTPDQISALREQTNKDTTYNDFLSILNGSKPKKKESTKVSFSQKKLDEFFPVEMSAKQREDVIIELLKKWKSEQ